MHGGIRDAPEPPRLLRAEGFYGVGHVFFGVPGVERLAFGRVGDGGADDEEVVGHGLISAFGFAANVSDGGNECNPVTIAGRTGQRSTQPKLVLLCRRAYSRLPVHILEEVLWRRQTLKSVSHSSCNSRAALQTIRRTRAGRPISASPRQRFRHSSAGRRRSRR